MSPYHLSQHPRDGVRRDFVQGWTTPDERGQGEPFSSASVEFEDGKAHIRTCFTAGTLIHTKEGLKVIEDIQIGDVVMSKSDVTGEVSYKKVVNTFIRQTDEIYNVKFENASILETTWNHPFRRLKTDGVASLLLDRGQIGSMDLSEWREARDLKKGDQIYSADGSLLVVESVIIEQREETVYNFEVEDFHTYFVGEDGVWVHNEAGCGQISLSATPKSMENGIKEKYNLAGDELKRVSEESAQAYNAANTIASKRALGLISEAEASKQLATIAKGKHPSILDAIEQGRSSGMLLGTVGLGSLAVPGIGIGVLAMPTISGAGTALGMKYATAGMTMSAYMAANFPKLSTFLNLAPSIGSQTGSKVHQEVKVGTELPIPKVNNLKLNNLVKDLYKGAKGEYPIGTGSTADAVRNEILTGKPTFNTFHSEKATQYINALSKWLKKNPDASHYDRLVAESLLHDLKLALDGK